MGESFSKRPSYSWVTGDDEPEEESEVFVDADVSDA